MAPLLLSGSSYLIPTLRIERTDTPESISDRIRAALEDSQIPNTGIVKSMLRGKATASGVSRWKAPVILDMSALGPDGSPHYARAPPQRGLLNHLVRVLGQYDIQVVGVTNSPPILEEEAVEKLGLPSFLSKARVLDRQSATSKVKIEDVVKMLLIKSKEENSMEEEEHICIAVSTEQVSEEMSEAPKEVKQDELHDVKPVVEEPKGAEKVNNEDSSVGESTLSPEGGTYVYQGSVRTGQQVAAPQNKSLIVIGSVNSGGEVLSDRDIFVFGKLRGRALAGLATSKHDESARIFATSFDPELICIGDTFTTVDAVSELGLNKPGEAAMVTLDSNRELVFQHIPL